MRWILCPICEADDAVPLAVGEDFEYRTSPDTFLVSQCRRCGLVYLNPQPELEALDRIYPEDYFAFQFSAKNFGFTFRVRRWLEGRRVLSYCRGVGPTARILDFGCGRGFHLDLLRALGQPGWALEGVDPSHHALERAETRQGIAFYRGFLGDLNLPAGSYDLVLMIRVLEHIPDMTATMRRIVSLLRPGGRLVLVTNNASTASFALLKSRHWGGYHFPRHPFLFSPRTLRSLSAKFGLEVIAMDTLVSPIHWLYSIHYLLTDYAAPRWLVDRFSVRSPAALGVFTAWDAVWRLIGRGSLLRAVLGKPCA